MFRANSLSTWLLISWLVVGTITTWFGFAGLLFPALSLLLLWPLILLGRAGYLVLKLGWSTPDLQIKTGLGCLIVIWLVHATGIFMPETGFDAVWYHLPIVWKFTQLHQVVYLPEYYQTLNPLFSDLIFLLGFQLGGELGAKLVAFLLALSLVVVTYQVMRWWLSPKQSLLAILLISTFQVVAWQASSFYVDVAKALWEVGALYALGQLAGIRLGAQLPKNKFQLHLGRITFPWVEVRVLKWLLLAGWCVGASLATKLFSLLLLPSFLIMVVIQLFSLQLFPKKIIVFLVIFTITAFSVVLPFYIFAYISVGTPFFSAEIHINKLAEIGGNSDLVKYVISRLLYVPVSGWQLVIARDYISPLLGLLLPIGLYQAVTVGSIISPKKSKNVFIKMAWLFILTQWFIWWLVPPLSTRYALSGFILLVGLLLKLLVEFIHRHPSTGRMIWGLVVLAIVLNTLPRMVVATRNIHFLVSRQTKQEYVRQFYDGHIDQHLDAWLKKSNQ